MNVRTMWLPLCVLAATVATVAIAAEPQPAAQTGSRDLCAQLDEYGHPARCEPTGPDLAPWWGGEVCCDADGCVEPGAAGCGESFEAYWCDHAELDADGSLTCLYEVPDYCDEHPCGGMPGDIMSEPEEHVICCYTECYDPEGGPCGGDLYWCGDGVSTMEGTVECFDDMYPVPDPTE